MRSIGSVKIFCPVKLHKTYITFPAPVCILGCICLLIIPIQWFISCFIAIMFHELCHYAALSILGIHVNSVTVRINAVIMDTETMKPWQEIICTICGPLGSFLLFISIRYFPRLALCGLIHGLYNLMPIYPLDGGRIVKCLLHIILPDPEREMRIQIILTTINLLFSIYILIILLRYSLWFLFVIPIFSLLREAIIKIPCKHGLKRVQ